MKTRLATAVGAECAAALHGAFLRTLVERCSYLKADRFLCYAPPAQREAFAKLASEGWSLWEQPEGNLGDRLSAFFDDSFASGCERAVVLGADSPSLALSTVQAAFDQLRERELVLGPTSDGGYYLVGASRQTPPIFRGMPWGKSSLWRATLLRLSAFGWRADRYAALPEWYDVDELPDLMRLVDELCDAVDPSLVRLRDTIKHLWPNDHP